MRGALAVLALALLLARPAAGALFRPVEFDSPAQKAQYKSLTEELRCLVCQNQTIAESNADLAADLRREVYKMVRAGSSKDEIIGFMVARYGNFVLYRPPVNAKTLLLWTGPFLFGVGALAYLVVQIRKRRRIDGVAELSEEERGRLARVLGPSPGEEPQ